MSGDYLTLFGKFILNVIELIEMPSFQTHFMLIFPLDGLDFFSNVKLSIIDSPQLPSFPGLFSITF
jgi:hypothetical protein